MTYQVRSKKINLYLRQIFPSLLILPLGLEGENEKFPALEKKKCLVRGFEMKVIGIKKGKISWLAYYIHYILVPRDSTGRCHGDGQKHQQIPSWILLKGGSIWSPLAWRYQLQHL